MAAKWLSAENLDNVAWLPADLKVLGKIKEIIGEETDKRIRRNQAKDEEKDRLNRYEDSAFGGRPLLFFVGECSAVHKDRIPAVSD